MSKGKRASRWRKRRWGILGVIGLAIIAVSLVFAQLPILMDKRFNPVVQRPPYPVVDSVSQIHQELWIADLHADSLLWNRDLSQKHPYGHVDLPRLQDANVALQVLTVVTKVPTDLKLENNDHRSDDILKLALIQRWPLSTWNSLLQRALYQAEKLHKLAESQRQFRLINNQADLKSFLQDRKRQPQLTASLLGLEGAHALQGRLENVDRLYEAGFRMLGLAHFFDTEVGGSAHGLQKGGLTRFGRQVIAKAQDLHLLIDLAHSSALVIDEVVALSTQPVVVSHTGVKGTCDNTRNLTDQQIKAIAKTGGVIGIGYWPTAICGNNAASIAKAIRYVVDLVGVDYVGLGSDFDGAVRSPFDVTGLPLITEALQAEGFNTEEMSKIMGLNLLRVLELVLPE